MARVANAVNYIFGLNGPIYRLALIATPFVDAFHILMAKFMNWGSDGEVQYHRRRGLYVLDSDTERTGYNLGEWAAGLRMLPTVFFFGLMVAVESWTGFLGLEAPVVVAITNTVFVLAALAALAKDIDVEEMPDDGVVL